ncbi:MAG TPA: NAD(P)H-hydrate dehydratase [Methylophilaceae bacterium]
MNLPFLYRVEQIRAIEQQHGTHGLMEQAGLAIADLACELIKENRSDILILAGPGNNGGDAFVTARHLKSRFYNTHVLFTGDAAKLPSDALAAYDAWVACGGKVISEIPPGLAFGLAIDGLFGIGPTRELDARYSSLIDAINALPTIRLAVDIPSGLSADTGRLLGAAIQADHTISFIARKPGLYTLDGPDHAGVVHTVDLGIVASPATPYGWLVDTLPATLAPRKRNSHKGSFGSVAVLGGATGMVGATLLAARAALLSGSGRVYCHFLAADAPLVDTDFPELMLRHSGELAENLDCIIVGPGMGRTAQATNQLRTALKTESALVLDADALHLLASDKTLRDMLIQRGNAVLTPHPGEAAVLLGCDNVQIQTDRVASALSIASRYHAIVVLKGAGSIVATPGGHWYINASGNPGLSAAGMGDVLTGIIAALIVQGLSIEQATVLAVYLHGKAADDLVADGIGPVGLKASEIALEVRSLLNEKNP